jgi:hypothetical protein
MDCGPVRESTVCVLSDHHRSRKTESCPRKLASWSSGRSMPTYRPRSGSNTVADASPTIVNARVIPWELEGAYGYSVAITWSDLTHEAYVVGNRETAEREVRRVLAGRASLKLVPPAKD